ncbi:hypothetical protein XHV734_0142 [Xanthomonas hortorum pv. vitians]|nr:hypothetical protein XHV734_0142 [Xanthomonas hortorum pv. vitians]
MVGHHDAVGPEAHRIARIVRVQDALDHHRPGPELADPFQVFPRNRRVEIGAQPADVILQAGRAAAIRRDIAQIVRLAEQAHVPGPARMRHRLQHAPQRCVGPAHARVRIAVARPRRGHVHGEHQRGDASCLGALQRIAHEAAVLEHVQLEPHRPLDRRRHFFDRAHRHRGQRKRNPPRRRRTRRLYFTTPRVHAGQPHRRQRHRHRQGLAEQLGAQAQVRHIAQHPLAQRDIGQIGDIAPQGVLGVRTAIDVVKQERRQARLRGGTVIGSGRNDHQRRTAAAG